MYGYLVAQTQALEKESFETYRRYYCGLCRSLQRWGLRGRLTLNYDMTFLVVLLSSLYEPEEKKGSASCLRHPFKGSEYAENIFSDYAADMNLALARYKALDNWHDDKSLSGLIASAAFAPAAEKIKEKWPRQCSAMETSIAKLSTLEAEKDYSPDEAADTFGDLMAEIFAVYEDPWARPLRDFGRSLGRFIYLVDACVDLDDDVKKGRSNPFAGTELPRDRRAYFNSMLRMTLGDGLAAFDYLPLVENTDILKNVLCLGLWTEFSKKYYSKDDTDAGSV